MILFSSVQIYGWKWNHDTCDADGDCSCRVVRIYTHTHITAGKMFSRYLMLLVVALLLLLLVLYVCWRMPVETQEAPPTYIQHNICVHIFLLLYYYYYDSIILLKSSCHKLLLVDADGDMLDDNDDARYFMCRVQ